MEEFEQKWGNKYLHKVKSWKKNNWEELMAYFKYPFEMRRLMYTTNIIESHNNKFRNGVSNKNWEPLHSNTLTLPSILRALTLI